MQKEAGQESLRMYFADVLNSSMKRKKKKSPKLVDYILLE